MRSIFVHPVSRDNRGMSGFQHLKKRRRRLLSGTLLLGDGAEGLHPGDICKKYAIALLGFAYKIAECHPIGESRA